MPLTEGSLFAGYTILRRLGAGGMGEVYLVEHPRLPRREALKVLPRELTHDLEYTDRFAREADIVSTLWHPNIVALHDRGEFDGYLWISMDFVDGTDAANLLQENPGGLPPADVAKIVTGIAEALDYAHENEMLHRDVKPANILIARNTAGQTRALLADFGIARRVDDPGTLTATNMTVGTVAYAAPEQLMGQTLDGRADQYALAATAFHLLTGLPLFQHTNPAVVISQHLTSPPPSIEERIPRLSALGPVFAKALAKSPEDRYASCVDFARAFSQQLEQPGGESPQAEPTVLAAAAKPPSGRRRKQASRSPWRIAVPLILAVLALVVAAIAVPALLKDRGPSSSSEGPPDDAPDTTSRAVASIAATVPEDIKSTGRLVVGVNSPYSPMEFKNASGQFDGFDIDLMDAIARTLGLTVEYREILFNDIIPQVQSKDVNVGLSSMTDTKEREALVDFVTYFDSGTLWAQRAGQPPIDPNAACGLKVGVKAGTVQDTKNLPAKSNVCVATGVSPIQIVPFAEQDSVTKALIAGDIDAMSADSPVTLFAIKLSGGALVQAGEVFSNEPYGWPVAKGSPLAQSLRLALEHLIKSGEYRTIAAMWGLEKGMIDKPVINGAVR